MKKVYVALLMVQCATLIGAAVQELTPAALGDLVAALDEEDQANVGSKDLEQGLLITREDLSVAKKAVATFQKEVTEQSMVVDHINLIMNQLKAALKSVHCYSDDDEENLARMALRVQKKLDHQKESYEKSRELYEAMRQESERLKRRG